MPIRPELKPLYPQNWPELAASVKSAADWRCEGSPAYPDCRAEHGEPHPVTGSIVVLTCAHFDQDVTNNDRANLKSWCQRCHLKHDEGQHIDNARRRREAEARCRETPDLFQENPQ